MPIAPPEPEPIEAAEVERLMAQAARGELDAASQKRLVPLLQTLLWLQRSLLEARISLSKLKRILFGKRTEKSSARPRRDPPRDGGLPPGHEPDTQERRPGDPATAEPAGTDTGAPTSSPPHPGHGRLGAADYPGAQRRFWAHERLAPGDRCPACARGRLYPMVPLVRLRFTGQPLAAVTRYELERLRCGACGAVSAASLPAEAGPDTYAVSLKVHLALAHYFLGLPFKRIESFQGLLGMPVPDATQWQLVEQVADCGYPIYEQLKHLGANQPLVYQDDTGARILSLIKENQADPPPARKGLYTTVLRFEGEHAICLYFTGRRHAGENLDAILALRDPERAPIQWMSDALAANTPTEHLEQTVDINCLVHGRRQFVEIEAFFPSECARVIEVIAAIYQHEAHCQDHTLSPAQRLAYHQAHSAPMMAALKAWMVQQIEDKQVEPNSRLGRAFEYLLTRWEPLTRFLHIPGAPLDNNTAERALKLIQRYRHNSLFYKNAHGAYVGDVLTSLIETCRLAGANAVAYLTALMENRSAVFADPLAWLPWNYADTAARTSKLTPLSHPPPVLGHPGLDRVAVP